MGLALAGSHGALRRAELGRIDIDKGLGGISPKQLVGRTHESHRDRTAPAAARINLVGTGVLADKA